MVADTVVIGVVEVDTRVTSTLPRDEEPSAGLRQPTSAASGLWTLPDLRCATLRRHRFYAKTKRARWMELLTRVSCWQRRSERSSSPHARCRRAGGGRLDFCTAKAGDLRPMLAGRDSPGAERSPSRRPPRGVLHEGLSLRGATSAPGTPNGWFRGCSRVRRCRRHSWLRHRRRSSST
jgi:hypothetical protein